MIASTHRKGPCPPDHDVASVTFDNANPNTTAKRYHYWVPKKWNAQPGDKLHVFVSERGELKNVTVRDMHFAGDFTGREHKLAVSITHTAPRAPKPAPPIGVVMDDWPPEPPAPIVMLPTCVADKPAGFVYYPQALDTRCITGVPPELLGTTPTGRWPHTIPAAQPKDTAMEIQNQTLINGRNIKDMTDDQLFDLIAAEEAKIKALRAIENKPQKLKDRINKMQKDIETLIQLIDER